MICRSLIVGLVLCTALPVLQAAPLNGRQPVDDIFYQYMPIAWRDSNNDASRFGDFGGMTASLDYLENLGVTAVWMTPIFPSQSYHGYQHGPADQVNSWFGTESQFWSFVQQAHSRGIKVFIDFVVYQIDTNSVYFQSAYNNPASPYDTWLAFTNAANTSYYGGSGTTWNGQSHSYINWNLKDSHSTNLEITWALHWLDPNGDLDPSDGIDGYRLDHVSYNDATESSWGYNIGWWNGWKAAVKGRNPDAFTFAEQADWGNNGINLLTGHDAALTKPFLFAARSAISGQNASGLYSTMASAVASVPAGHTLMGSVGDHDVDRLTSAIGSTGSFARAKSAAAVLLTTPFPPIIYYGDEIGMLGTKANWGTDANDIPMREPFKWNAVAGPPMSNYYVLHNQAYTNSFSKNNDGRSVQEQQRVSGSLLEEYKTLIATRRAHIALRRGSYTPVTVSTTSVWSFLRWHEEESLLVAIRLAASQGTFTLNLSSLDLPGGSSTVQDVITGQFLPDITTANKSAYSITVAGNGYKILAVNLAPVRPPAGPTDGVNIPTDMGPGSLIATQNNATAVGDNICELDQLFVHPAAGGLRVGITGDLATDGTGLVLLLDTIAGGQNVLNFSGLAPPPAGPNLMTGLRFDTGFSPDQMFFINTNGGTTYVDHYTLPTSSGATKTYRGHSSVNTGDGTLTGGTNPSGMLVGMDNTNALGVTDTSASGAATATSGFEMFIPYSYIGVSASPPRGSVGIAAFILRTSGEVTNQWLPGLGSGYANPGLAPNMTTFPGQQFATVALDLPGDLNGDGSVDSVDLDLFDACSSGPDLAHNGSTICQAADFDHDTDVDQANFGVFQRCFSGSDSLSDPNCAN